MRAERSFESTIKENPLALGAVALAVGAAIGLSLPSTHTEDEWMGSMKDQLVDRAEDLAGDALHKVESTVVHQLAVGEESQSENGASHEGKNGLSNGISHNEKPRAKTSSI